MPYLCRKREPSYQGSAAPASADSRLPGLGIVSPVFTLTNCFPRV